MFDDRVKLMHDAAVGSVDKKQVETLMAQGLTEGGTVNVVTKGLLR
ncbi:MAG TPA: SufD family Fe-S cluster assembly protein [Blastocatellia bacterium]|nr:SufD family Fe-S cluster assembly protein [Blastocatellia bacterium]